MNYHLSKKDHQEHHAKLGLLKIAKDMLGGLPLDQEAHDKHRAAAEQAKDIPHLFLCPFGPHVFEPQVPPEHITIVGAKVILPGGEVVWPEKADTHELPPMLAICKLHGAKEVAKAFTHKWATSDHTGKPLEKAG